MVPCGRLQILVFLGSAVLVGYAAAQSQPPPPHHTARVSLADSLDLALRHNPAVRESRLQWRISKHAVEAAWGEFEPDVVARYNHTDLKRENSVQQSLSQLGQNEYAENTDDYDIGIEGKTLTGGTYWAGYTLERKDSSLTDVTEFTTFTGVTLEQPLLKNGWYDPALVQIRLARRDRAIAFEQFRKQLMLVVSEVESAYWNLKYAQMRRALAEESLDLAERLVRDSRERERAGRISGLELLDAEAGLAVRRSAHSDAVQQEENAMWELKLLMADAPLISGVDVESIDPLLPPSLADALLESRQALQEWALTAQPDYLIRTLELERADILYRHRKNQQLPELVVSGRLGVNGLGESAADANLKARSQEHPTLTVAAEFRVPLLSGISEKNELAAAELRLDVAESKLAATKLEIAQSIDILRQRAATLQTQIAYAGSVIDIKEQQLETQFALLEAGRASNREVYGIEDELFQARETQLEYIYRYRETLVKLALVSGTNLRNHGYERVDGERVFLLERLLTGEDG